MKILSRHLTSTNTCLITETTAFYKEHMKHSQNNYSEFKMCDQYDKIWFVKIGVYLSDRPDIIVVVVDMVVISLSFYFHNIQSHELFAVATLQ